MIFLKVCHILKYFIVEGDSDSIFCPASQTQTQKYSNSYLLTPWLYGALRALAFLITDSPASLFTAFCRQLFLPILIVILVVRYDCQDPLETEFCLVFSHSLLNLILLPFHFDNLTSVRACSSLKKRKKMCDYGSEDCHSDDN